MVNPTNSKLFGTAGVDGAIHTIEGSRLQEETAKLAPVEPGCCVLTRAFKLPTEHIIHTIGPVWKDGRSGEAVILSSL